MPTIAQDDFYRVGTIGLPIRITLLDKKNVPLPLDGTVLGVTLTFIRPDKSKFSRVLTLPNAIFNVNGVLEYIVQSGDLTVAGNYEIDIVITYANAVLPLKGLMQVLR